ncbi:MAG: hypothetical protein V4727_07935 [Verrucomicrobiota bacterium]
MAVTQIDSPHNPSPETEKSQIRREGFIDEALVRKMVMGNTYQRQQVKHEEMAMSSSEDDYAGWNLSASASFGRAA